VSNLPALVGLAIAAVFCLVAVIGGLAGWLLKTLKGTESKQDNLCNQKGETT